MLARLIENYADEDPVSIAVLYAYTGDTSSAITWMEQAIKEDPGNFSDSEVWDPRLANLHNTHQWQQWRKDAGLDEETLAAIEFNIPYFGTESAATR